MAGTAGKQTTRARGNTRVRQTAVPRPVAASAPQAVAAAPERAAPEGGFEALMERAQEQILAVTYWFDPAPRPAPYSATVRFIGQRVGIEGKPQARDTFMQEEVIDQVVPGSGPMALTAKVDGINPGEWEVSARVISTSPRSKERAVEEHSHVTLGPATRLWQRWAPSAEENLHVKTCPAPFAHIPGALPLIWVTMVTIGMIVAVIVQALVIAHGNLQLGPAFPLTAAAIGVGIAGAKVWFIVKHRAEHRFEGWCIQGFVTGAGIAAALFFTLAHMPTGAVLDVSAPGLMFGITIGRFGCFLAGCCGGPPTAARWGIWSSDQRIGARRVPTQLLESGAALILGLLTLVGVLTRGPAGGAYFVAAVAAYVLLREGLLRMRVEQMPSRLQVPVTAIVSALVLVGSLVFIVR